MESILYKINTIIQSFVKIGIDEGENVLARILFLNYAQLS